MPRAGRELELLVRMLEDMLSGPDVMVTSPEIVADKDTGIPRELDVAIRTTVGSTKVLIMIECRDREEIQDVTWIEQIAAKRTSVGAHKAVAVSSSPFTEGAVEKAQRVDIELRLLSELTPGLIKRWVYIPPEGIDVVSRQYTNMNGNIHINVTEEQLAEIGTELDLTDELKSPKFRHQATGESVTTERIREAIFQGNPQLFEDVPLDGSHIKVAVDVYFQDEASQVQLETKYGNLDIHHITYLVEAWTHSVEKQVPVVKRYSDEQGKTIAETIQLKVRPGNGVPEITATIVAKVADQK